MAISSIIGFSGVGYDEKDKRIKAHQEVGGFDTKTLSEDLAKAEALKGKKHRDALETTTTQLAEFKTLEGHLKGLHGHLQKMTARTRYDQAHAFSSVSATATYDADPPTGLPTVDFAQTLSNTKRQNLIQEFTYSATQAASKDTLTRLDGPEGPEPRAVTTSIGSRSTQLGMGGTLTLALSDVLLAEAEEITLEENDTIDDVATKINSISETTKVSARIVYNGDSTGYVLQLQADETGYAVQVSKDITSGVWDYIPDANYDGTTGVTESALEDTLAAKFTFSGDDYTRRSNKVNDVVEGMTINVKGATNQTYNISIGPDVKSASETIEAYRDAHNMLVDYLKEKTEIDPVTFKPLEGSVFAESKAVKDLQKSLTKMASLLSKGTAIDASYQNSSTVGLSMDVNDAGKILFDSAAFQEAFQTEPENVRRLFTFEAAFDSEEMVLTSPASRWALEGDALWGGNDFIDVVINKDEDDVITVTFDINGHTVTAKHTEYANNILISALDPESDFESDDTFTDATSLFKNYLRGLTLSYTVDPTTIATDSTTTIRMTASQGSIDIFGQGVGDHYRTTTGEREKRRVFTEKDNLTSTRIKQEARVKKADDIAEKKRLSFEKKMAKAQGALAKSFQQLQRIDILLDSFRVRDN